MTKPTKEEIERAAEDACFTWAGREGFNAGVNWMAEHQRDKLKKVWELVSVAKENTPIHEHCYDNCEEALTLLDEMLNEGEK